MKVMVPRAWHFGHLSASYEARKKYLKYSVVIILVMTVFPSMAFANCGVTDAKIVGVHQYFDGHVFVNFDKATNCNCSQTTRMAFDVKNPDNKFIQSMVLMAYASNRRVSALSSSQNCVVHSNTPVMDYFHVYPD